MYCMLINLTPHTINLHTALGVAAIPSDGEARAAEEVAETITLRWDQFGDCGMSEDVPLAVKRYGAVTGLPEPRKHCLYIVSTLVQQACPERTDLVSPDQVIRDGGRVVGCRGFYRLDPGPGLPADFGDRTVERARREGAIHPPVLSRVVPVGTPVYHWADRDAFARHMLALGGSGDTSGGRVISTDADWHVGRYPRQAYPDRHTAGTTMSFCCSWYRQPSTSGVVVLAGAPWSSPDDRDAAYAVLASAGCTPNDANETEKAIAAAAIKGAMPGGAS